MSFDDLMALSGLWIDECAALFQVTPRTVQYWRRYGAPHYAVEMLSLRAGTNRHWRHYRILDGSIILPCGTELNKNRIGTVPYVQQLLHSSIGECRKLRAENDTLRTLQQSSNESHISDLYETQPIRI